MAEYVNVYLKQRTGHEFNLNEADMGVFLDFFKLSRFLCNPNHDDNLKDKAGYIDCLYQCKDSFPDTFLGDDYVNDVLG